MPPLAHHLALAGRAHESQRQPANSRWSWPDFGGATSPREAGIGGCTLRGFSPGLCTKSNIPLCIFRHLCPVGNTGPLAYGTSGRLESWYYPPKVVRKYSSTEGRGRADRASAWLCFPYSPIAIRLSGRRGLLMTFRRALPRYLRQAWFAQIVALGDAPAYRCGVVRAGVPGPVPRSAWRGLPTQ